jgi:hypothetical protein
MCPKCDDNKGMKKVFQGNTVDGEWTRKYKKLSPRAMFRVRRNKDEKGNEKPLRAARSRGSSARVRYFRHNSQSKYKIIFKCENSKCGETVEFIGNSYRKVAKEVKNNLSR